MVRTSSFFVPSSTVSVLAIALSCAMPFAAQANPEVTEPYLSIVPRTEAEAQRIKAATALPSDFSKAEPFEDNPAGKATTRARTDHDAFSQSSESLSFEHELDFKLGNGLFKKLWVSSPSSTLASDGLGPVYNARSCQRCHLKDGRGHTLRARMTAAYRCSCACLSQRQTTRL